MKSVKTGLFNKLIGKVVGIYKILDGCTNAEYVCGMLKFGYEIKGGKIILLDTEHRMKPYDNKFVIEIPALNYLGVVEDEYIIKMNSGEIYTLMVY